MSLPRDVIEQPIVDELDVNGWDLPKTMRLFRKSNPSLMEWLFSPVVYLERETFAGRLREWVHQHYSLHRLTSHYLSMAGGNFRTHLQGESEVRLKKYLYVLRPLVCIRWVEQRMGPPPTSIWATLEGVELPVAVRSSLVELLHRKMEADELGTGSPNPSLHDFIQSELDRIPEAITHLPHRNPPSMNWCGRNWESDTAMDLTIKENTAKMIDNQSSSGGNEGNMNFKKEEKYRAILQAAMNVMLEKGFDKTTISEIVKEAGVAHGTFYVYFPSKNAIVPAIAEWILQQQLEEIQGRTRECTSIKETIQAMIDLTFETTLKHKEVIIFCYSGLAFYHSFQRWEEIYQPYYDWFKKQLEAARTRKEINPGIDLDHLVRMLINLMENTAETHFFSEEKPEVNTTIKLKEDVYSLIHKALV